MWNFIKGLLFRPAPIEKPLSEKLFANILLPRQPKDHFRWPQLRS